MTIQGAENKGDLIKSLTHLQLIPAINSPWYRVHFLSVPYFNRPVQCGVSKGVEDISKRPGLRAGHPKYSHKVVLEVEGSGMAGLGENLRSLWIPVATWACFMGYPGGPKD
jgi:hypothetical protein